MGLFDIFKKKLPTHSEKVDLAYRCYKPEMVGMIYPGGKAQAGKIITSLSKIYGINLDTSDAKKYYDILTTYSDVVIRKVVTQSSDDHIVTSLQVKHGDLIKSKAIAQKALAFVTLNMNNNDFSIEADDDMAALDFMTDMFSQMEQTASQNADAENDNLDDPEYGLVVTKPIYTKGVNGSNRYLEELKTSLGEKLTWRRLGSTSAEGINGMIDIYECTLPSGKPYKTVYVNMYGSANSKKIPKGFSK